QASSSCLCSGPTRRILGKALPEEGSCQSPAQGFCRQDTGRGSIDRERRGSWTSLLHLPGPAPTAGGGMELAPQTAGTLTRHTAVATCRRLPGCLNSTCWGCTEQCTVEENPAVAAGRLRVLWKGNR